MEISDIARKRNLLLLALCAALIQTAIYYIAGATVRVGGGMAIAQPDTLLYSQAARRIAEGFPFSFSEGTAASTGTTSVLYPFVLALPYAIGFTGGALFTAGFLLNAVFYVLFVLGWSAVACRAFAERPAARCAAVALVVSFGPFAYCALAQSDTGLWMAVSAWLAYGLYSDSRRVYVPLLLLAPWVRPEGMVVVVAYCAFCAFDVVRRRRIGLPVLVAVAAVASSLGVFVLNYALTGECQFSSVANKGYFTNLSVSTALVAAAIDAMKIAKAYLLGIPQESPRDMFYLPVVGAAFLWIGIFSRAWRDVSWRELAWYLAMAGGAATVATSGWQNTNLDRYLIWTMPVLLLHTAYGAEIVSSRLSTRAAKTLPLAAVVVFSAGMALVFVCLFHGSSKIVELDRSFASRCEEVLPKGCPVGALGIAGLAYEMSPRRVAHLSGIYSPEFRARSSAATVEILKNEPSVRFDYWLTKIREKKLFMCDKPDIVAGPAVLTCPPDMELRKSDWSAYDAAEEDPAPGAAGLSLSACVDVAYERDEKVSGYEPLTRDGCPLFAPFHAVGKLGGANILEGGRFLYGGDVMSVPLRPGCDVHVVMRTALKCNVAAYRESDMPRCDFELKSPMTLRVLVDGEDAGDVSFPVEEGDFSDARFVIPGRFVKQPNPRITLLGEHVAFAYWFFQ